MMDQSVIFIFAGVIVVGAAFLGLICITKKGSKHLNVDQYRIKYLQIENSLRREEASSYHLSVLSADKLLDQALRESGVKGQTMGERMKNCNAKFSDANGVWNAHKLRNRIAHETDAPMNYEESRRAVANFKRALKDIGAI